MRRVLVVSVVGGLLILNAAAVALLLGPLASDSSADPALAPAPTAAQQQSQLAVTPAAVRPPGAQDMEAALASVGAIATLGSWPSWCGAPPEGPWKTFGVTADGTHVAIVIASAGDGARLWQQQMAELAGCTQFRIVESTPTSLTLRRTDVPVSWVVARHDDVLVSVLQVSDTASTESLATIADAVVQTTAAQCLSNPDDDLTRNPWRAGYQPWHPPVPIDTPDPKGPKVIPESAVVEWAPPAPRERPDLAVVAKPDVTFNPYTTEAEVAPIGRVPLLVDPAEFVPPAVERPAAAPPESPRVPNTATAYFAREDTVGPGCGWAFAGTVAPAFDATLPGRELESRIDNAFATTAHQTAAWLQWSMDARARALEDAQTRAALAAWAAYDEALQQANDAQEAAVLRRLNSLKTWYAYVPVDPLVAPTAPPTVAPTADPSATPAPTATPASSPTATAVR
ncbi:MAG: hypothetical protein PHU75_09845 [Candidatus Nanopelagicales bacterium]|nr:hypothetical protein [Candidatus Nanopelagicales bacterium]